MTGLIPYLVIRSPTGSEQKLDLRDTCYSIGRLPDNDISLTEDPDSLITRIKHCTLERVAGQWTLTDNSTNGTRVQWDGEIQDITHQTVALTSGILILIHGWEITFNDPDGTNKVRKAASTAEITPQSTPGVTPFIYKVSQATLYLQSGQQRTPISPRPKVNLMLRYMAQQNLDKGESMVCGYGDLIACIWEGSEIHNHTAQDINSLARDIRKLFEQHGSKTDATNGLITVRGFGYRLNIPCEW